MTVAIISVPATIRPAIFCSAVSRGIVVLALTRGVTALVGDSRARVGQRFSGFLGCEDFRTARKYVIVESPEKNEK